MTRIDTPEKPLNCTIVGASHAGTTLALQLRREGWTGPIRLIGAEAELPYHRPPLSKAYLDGDKELDTMRLRPLQHYQDNGIDLILGTTVLAIDADAQALRLSDGEALHYDRLALCTGAHVKTLQPAPDLANVHYIRTVADVKPLRESLQQGLRACVVGGGFIGLEVAAVMAAHGLDVTLLERETRLLPRVTGETLSGFMQALHERQGVDVRPGVHVLGVTGESRAEVVRLSDGSELAVDLMVVGIGVEPGIGLAETAELEIADGILVNEYTQTSVANIFAAGDCTSWFSARYGRRLRLESVQNATEQARVAAANIAGRPLAYDTVPWFWSDQYHIKLQMAGLSQGHDDVVVRGDPANLEQPNFTLFYRREGRLLAADCLNSPKEFMATKQLLQHGIEPTPEQLAESDFDLAELLKKD